MLKSFGEPQGNSGKVAGKEYCLVLVKTNILSLLLVSLAKVVGYIFQIYSHLFDAVF